mgnify:CR=1 FL=1
MKKAPSAKKLTFLYFSVVAFALIAIHASVFELTTEDMEHIYAKSRLSKIEAYIRKSFSYNDLTAAKSIEIQPQNIDDFYENPVLFIDRSSIPSGFPNIDSIEPGEDIEVVIDPLKAAYFVRKISINSAGTAQDALLVINNTLYESSEQQLLTAHIKQIAISLLLAAISLIVVLKISDRLTKPISDFANTLADKSSDDLEPIPLPQGTYTLELQQMLETFNAYQEKIHDLLERERAFNRYTSHELRSPLMVMQGAITLLGESQDAAFINKQRLRLQKATSEIGEFIETLLTLTKAVDEDELLARELSESELEDIVRNQQHLLRNKPVEWHIKMQHALVIRMPEAAFHILLGNVIKNAFAWTAKGNVTIHVSQTGIQVIDTGPGLNNKQDGIEGFGLGLLLVRDICHRYGWHFELREHPSGGCCAAINFDNPATPDTPITS